MILTLSLRLFWELPAIFALHLEKTKIKSEWAINMFNCFRREGKDENLTKVINSSLKDPKQHFKDKSVFYLSVRTKDGVKMDQLISALQILLHLNMVSI